MAGEKHPPLQAFSGLTKGFLIAVASSGTGLTTLSLTSVFTPPASCSSSWWTYENSGYNSVSNGLLIQNAVAEIQTECFPPDWANFGRAQATQVYSPGWCPAGYTTAADQMGRAVTTATCCLSYVSSSAREEDPPLIGLGAIRSLQR